MKLSLRTKITAGFVAVVALIGAVSTLAGTRMLGEEVVRQAQIKVANDLNTAHYVFDEAIGDVASILADASIRSCLVDNLLKQESGLLLSDLKDIRKRGGLDVLGVADTHGRVIVRGDSGSGGNVGNIGVVRKVLESGAPVSGVEVLSGEALRLEGRDLAARARIRFVPTPRARPNRETESTSGMMLMAASPIRGHKGELIGVIYGGNLVNRDYRIVDGVKRIVFRDLTYRGRDVGTTTIFLKDMRISTNVRQADGSRAIGTRVWSEVYEKVVERGERWLGRAFVVTDWYISAYEPIRDISGRIVGILYVGLLEKEYTDMKWRMAVAFLFILAAGMVVVVGASYFIAGRITGPLRRLSVGAQRMGEGDLRQWVEPGEGDEIGELTKVFNDMAHAIAERDERLKRQTMQMVANSDRLATVGQLAAGVAHEINNPMGGILVYAHLLLEDPAIKGEAKASIERIVVEASRCRNIVRGLLDFSRESKPEKGPVEIGSVVESALSLVEKSAQFKGIEVVRGLAPGVPRLEADRGQLTQVFVNMLMNAAEAMDGKGRLSVAAGRSADGSMVEVTFTDTGSGITPANMERLFDPFFTTKEVGKGTGLGLAISFGIVRAHGGTIEVRSEVGRGSTFTVKIPLPGFPSMQPV